jgi:hypothetical protein
MKVALMGFLGLCAFGALSLYVLRTEDPLRPAINTKPPFPVMTLPPRMSPENGPIPTDTFGTFSHIPCQDFLALASNLLQVGMSDQGLLNLFLLASSEVSSFWRGYDQVRDALFDACVTVANQPKYFLCDPRLRSQPC